MMKPGQNNNNKMASDPAFKSAGIRPGLQIWRVENFALKAYPEKDFGKFYEGDSYVALKTEGRVSPFNYHIHFWLGKKTSKDEAGTAAMKAVELDDYLGGSPVQYREIQEHEGKQFQSYFKKLEYRPGGVASGFKHVEDEHRKRLLQIKGKKRPKVFEVPVQCDSLNRGDCFILDNGTKIWVWCGSESNRLERIKAVEIAKEIRDDMRAGRAHIFMIEEKPNEKISRTDKEHPVNKFYADLGSMGSIKPASAGGSDEKVARAQLCKVTLHRVSDESGTIKVDQVASGALKVENLDSNDSFILDQGGTQIFVWIGKKSTKEEKLASMKIAVNFLRTNGYPDWTPVTRITEGAEPPIFKQCFTNWPRCVMTGKNKTYTAGRGVAHVEQKKFDAALLHEKRKREEERMFDDGSGNVEVWRIENFELVLQPKELYGTFFGGDSYVILYTYQKNNKSCFVVYYWLGTSSTQDEQGAAALHAVKVDDKLGGAAVQIRIVQGKESEHFMRIFKGKMIIYRGGKASGFRGAKEEIKQSGNVRLFQVRSRASISRKATEVEPVAASLNSNDVFVLCTKKEGYLWYGKGCSGDERELAKEVAHHIAPHFANDFFVTMEGKEPEAFWEGLGGKGEYASGGRLEEITEDYPARLFHCSNATGRFEVEEICNFSQDDLEEDDVMILDAWDQVFVWIGKDSNQTEKKEALKTVVEYVKSDPSGRSVEDTELLVVKEGYEPPMFTGHFEHWDSKRFTDTGAAYEQAKNSIQTENDSVTLVAEELTKFSFDKKYPYSVLIEADPEKLPEGIDPTRKELYLEPEEFCNIFGMKLSDYEGLPQWKKNNMKKKVSLF